MIVNRSYVSQAQSRSNTRNKRPVSLAPTRVRAASWNLQGMLSAQMRNALDEPLTVDGRPHIAYDTNGNTIRGLLRRGLIDKLGYITEKGRAALEADNRKRLELA